jgi:hypothetical protein
MPPSLTKISSDHTAEYNNDNKVNQRNHNNNNNNNHPTHHHHEDEECTEESAGNEDENDSEEDGDMTDNDENENQDLFYDDEFEDIDEGDSVIEENTAIVENNHVNNEKKLNSSELINEKTKKTSTFATTITKMFTRTPTALIGLSTHKNDTFTSSSNSKAMAYNMKKLFETSNFYDVTNVPVGTTRFHPWTNRLDRGINSRLTDSKRGDEIYYMGVIDILQQYNSNKFAETMLKVIFLFCT